MTSPLNLTLPSVQILTVPSKDPLKLSEILQTCILTTSVISKHEGKLIYIHTPSITLAVCKHELISAYLDVSIAPENVVVISCHLPTKASLLDLRQAISTIASIKVTDLVTAKDGLSFRFTALIRNELAVEYVWNQSDDFS
jgi:hypothetical protein